MIEAVVFILLLAGVALSLGIVFLYVDFVCWILFGERHFDGVRIFTDKVLIVLAVFALAYDYRGSADAWGLPLFTPSHQPYFGLLTLCCIIAYFYSAVRSNLGPALLEITVNSLLFIAILLNTLTGVNENHGLSWVFCTIPIFMVLIMTLANNYRLALDGLRNRPPP
ncbi:MAG TPA: hypothetical protein VFE32_05440 [Puia sp.]|nr:hypothetical protein [Puia sp.]